MSIYSRDKKFKTQNLKLKFLALIFVIASFTVSGNSKDIYNIFIKANSLYENGNYDEAIKEYNSILKEGFESGNLYYNLGNCYFRKGQLGMAILNYKKAKRLLGYDRDLDLNYKYVTSLIREPKVIYSRPVFLKILDKLFVNFSLDGLTIFSSLLYILLLASITLGFFLRKFFKACLFFGVLIFLVFIVTTVELSIRVYSIGKEAVVITKEAFAKFEPTQNATNHFDVYEGMTIEIISKKDDWYKIKRSDGLIGWLRKEDLEVY